MLNSDVNHLQSIGSSTQQFIAVIHFACNCFPCHCC